MLSVHTQKRGLTVRERQWLEVWLSVTPLAWSGWPTYRPEDRADMIARYDRIIEKGFMVSAEVEPEIFVEEVDTLIAQIRAQKRKTYTQQVREYCW